ncbi:MAG: FeoB-associated Cys-rich membrane protein [Bacteroidaceae bacterium]|nr:FeoB-associated Cys-rich membrane protein [Bacteroidaceae bacterium]
MQDILVAIILSACVIFAVWRIWKNFHRPKCDHVCAGCPLADKCGHGCCH